MSSGDVPPDECIEILLWEKFHWSPAETDKLSSTKLRRLFLILEQQRVSSDSVQNLQPVDIQKVEQMELIKKQVAEELKEKK